MATETTKKKSWVQKTPGVCGGRACIRDTRITVWGLVNSRKLGAADEALLKSIAGLTRRTWKQLGITIEAIPSRSTPTSAKTRKTESHGEALRG